jgi:hypothetical protein
MPARARRISSLNAKTLEAGATAADDVSYAVAVDASVGNTINAICAEDRAERRRAERRLLEANEAMARLERRISDQAAQIRALLEENAAQAERIRELVGR